LLAKNIEKSQRNKKLSGATSMLVGRESLFVG